MNSLTANNRLSQQLVVSVAEHLLLRHECRLPNHLAVSNHRELYLTVGGKLCRNLTAGFVTEEDFMFMLFVGNQKHSALSIFAKTTRMSALVLCGNSGVILLSAKRRHNNGAIMEIYTKRIWSFFPVARANFFSVANDGPLTPEARLLSILVMAVALVPMRSATSAWVRPASLRAASISSSSANSSAMASYSALKAWSSIHLAAISSCVMVGGVRLPVMLNLLHSGFSFFAFSWWGFLGLLDEAMQHDDAFSCQGAVKDACDAITAFNPKLEKSVTEGAGMRFSEIAAVYFHALNKMLVSGTHTQWKLIDLQSDLFTVVFDSIVHELKHNKIVMFAQCIDSVIPGCVDNIYLSGHTLHIVAKSTIGSETPELSTAIYDAPASFLSSALTHARIMVGWAGEPKGSPVSVDAGSLNPVQSATSEIETSGGGSFPQSTEAAIMATVPAITRLNDEDLHKLSYITTALRALRKVTLSDPQAHQVLVETILNLQAERIRLADKANFHIHCLLNISGGHRHA